MGASGGGGGIEAAPLLAAEQCGAEGVKTRRRRGGWRSARFVMGAAAAERFASSGVSANLITYLTGPLAMPTAAASEAVNTWSGFASVLPLLGAFIADEYLGRYRTVVFSSLLYLLGLGMLIISVILNPSSWRGCDGNGDKEHCSSSNPVLVILFFSSLYISAIALGGVRPCTQAFGADQFDDEDPEECKSRSSFFNWWDCVVCFGNSLSYLTLIYVQENVSWGLGFGITCIFMVVSLLVFLLGSKTYRYRVEESGKSPLVRVARVFICAAKNWRLKYPLSLAAEEETTVASSDKFKFLDKALFTTSVENREDPIRDRVECSITDVNEAKGLLKLLPIWCVCLPYAVVFAQLTTFFTQQGSTMERSIGSHFQVPAAVLQTLTNLSITLLIPIYDLIFVPVVKTFTGKPSGITTLQRIGCGMFISVVCMVVAALVEKRRLDVAFDFGLIDNQGAMVPMSIWWLAPQYLLRGLADVFIFVGMQEFFYDQVPNGLKSIGVGIHWTVIGVGNFLSSLLISILENATSASGQGSWFPNNINKGHLDYFYMLLAAINIASMLLFMYFAKLHTYNRWSNI
ncbi:hypothetical protein Syun_003042 [Stephania yunnanensis]|uniref:Uncharacterized protein n=1 Tax=Stephania yunnanensis TaxID=152371 RepID=A0AAP0L1H9_9MAGN